MSVERTPEQDKFIAACAREMTTVLYTCGGDPLFMLLRNLCRERRERFLEEQNDRRAKEWDALADILQEARVEYKFTLI